MKQNDFYLAKILLVLMSISLIGALYYYFKDSEGDLKWQSYQEAKISASQNNKPILLCFYNSLSAKTKQFSGIINSDDKLKKLIQNDFILARLKTNDKEDRKTIESEFSGTELMMNLILDSYSRPVQFLFGGISARQIESLLNHIQSVKFILNDNFQKAMANSQQNQKPLLVLISDHLNKNIELFEFVKLPKNKEFLEKNFNLTALLTYTKDDEKTLKSIESKIGNKITKPDYYKGSFLILDVDYKTLKLVDFTRELVKDDNFINELTPLINNNSQAK